MTSVTKNLRSLLESTPHALAVTPEQLARFWDYVSKKYHDEEKSDSSYGPWERPYGTCTNLNSSPTAMLRKAGHSVRVFGCFEDDMENSELWTKYNIGEGHDWAVVDDHWIIDQWAASNLGVPKAIHDLRDPKTAKLYPPRDTWEEMSADGELEGWFEEAAEDWAEFQKQDCAPPKRSSRRSPGSSTRP